MPESRLVTDNFFEAMAQRDLPLSDGEAGQNSDGSDASVVLEPNTTGPG